MSEKKKETKKKRRDYKEVRPPIETNDLSFDEMLKKVANAKLAKVTNLSKHPE